MPSSKMGHRAKSKEPTKAYGGEGGSNPKSAKGGRKSMNKSAIVDDH